MGDKPNQSGLSRKHIMDSIDGSLKRLGTDYVDLYQIHRWDSQTPIEETMEALKDVLRAGKARYIGASSMFAWQFYKALHTADLNGWTRFVSMQNHYNLVYREEEREMIPLCMEEGVGITPWSPLARGFLAGNRRVKGEGNTTEPKAINLPIVCIINQAILKLWTGQYRWLKRRRLNQSRLHWPGCCKNLV
jgi:aryl-alcohol dehydrogenase (NADP+)